MPGRANIWKLVKVSGDTGSIATAAFTWRADYEGGR